MPRDTMASVTLTSGHPAPHIAPTPARARLSLFGRSQSGSTAVEFGLVSLPFLGLLAAIFQTCLAFLMQQGLRVALDEAARQVLTGQAQTNTGVTSWQTFRDKLVCPSSGSILPSFITCANIVVDVRAYSSFSLMSSSSVTKSFLTDGTGPQYLPGNACDIVVVRAIYPMPVFLPFITGTTLGSNVTTSKAGLTNYNGGYVQMLTAAAVFRNEPYVIAGATTPAGCS